MPETVGNGYASKGFFPTKDMQTPSTLPQKWPYLHEKCALVFPEKYSSVVLIEVCNCCCTLEV